MTAAETLDASDRTALEALQEALDATVSYIGGAGATAGASVKSAAGKTGELVGAGAYKGAYGVSYGLVFGAVFLKELLPVGNALRRGFEDGADAAFTAVETRKAKVAEPAAAPKRASRKAKAAAEE